MKYFQIKWAALSFGLLLLAACSGGGGGGKTPSTLTITAVDSAGKTSTLAADTSNATFVGTKNTTENKTVIQMCADVDKDNDCSQVIIMTMDGTSEKEYDISSLDSVSQIVYHDDDLENGITKHYISNNGKIKVTGIGTAGDPVRGTFNATLECNAGCTGNVNVTGSFNVVLSN